MSRSEVLERAAPSSEGMIVLQRREKELEQNLRYLLDAQSDALMAGINGDPLDDVLSNGSTTPTVHSPRSSTRSPARPSARRKLPGLLSARRGIYKTVRELVAIKTQEEALTKEERRQSESVLQHLEAWGKKRAGLQKQIGTIQHEDVELKTRHLQTEADALQEEITQTEQKLARMRRRHRSLLEEIAQVDNSVQSKLSSYQASLTILEKEIKNFLSNPPIPDENKSNSNLLSLPLSRRTLDIAHSYFASVDAAIQKRSSATKKERKALEQGAAVWKDCVSNIIDFEQHLKQEMASLNPSNSEASISGLLSAMDNVIASVEDKFHLAKSKNWKLLIVCIGAELEAFKQGRAILEGASGTPADKSGNDGLLKENDDLLNSRLPEGIASPPVEKVGKHSLRSPKVLSPPIYDSDEGPDPDLMVSKQDTDTE